MTVFNKIFLFFKPLAVNKQLSLPSKSGDIEELEIFPNDSMKEKIQNIWEKMTLHWKEREQRKWFWGRKNPEA